MSRAGAFLSTERKAVKALLGKTHVRVLMSEEIDERKDRATAEILDKLRQRHA